MNLSPIIPETGQQTEVVRLHPIDWNQTVAFIRELHVSLALRTLIINDNFSINEKFIVDALIEYCRNYMLTIHFNHYVRLNVALNGYTPSKGRAFYTESVPEIFLLIARHLARPRLLIDGSVSLPIPNAPICDGHLYGGLAALANNEVVRNLVVLDAPNPTLSAINVGGSPIHWRPRLYVAIRRNFSGMTTARPDVPEGLVPARMCYWQVQSNCFVHFLDLSDEFEKAIFKIDCLLCPLRFDVTAPAAPVPGANAAALAQYIQDIFPQDIQWMANDVLNGQQNRMSADQFLEREASAYHVTPVRTPVFCTAEFMATLSDELKDVEFPKPGTVPASATQTLRQLVNDLGDGRPPARRSSSRRDNRRRSNRAERRENAARRELSTEVKTDILASDENAIPPEDAKEEDTDSIRPDLIAEKKKKKKSSRNAARRLKSKS